MSATPENQDQPRYRELENYIAHLGLRGRDASGRRAVLIQVLHKAQELFGYLPKEVQAFVAGRLDLHLSEVYGVVSFYHYFKTRRQGRHNIEFCLGTACFVRGAAKLIEKTESLLGVKVGETTADGRFTLGTLRCVGACSLAPVVQVGGKTYGRVTVEQLPAILAEHK
jgi:NADH:ubiquinone oxidoreductase subunit E